MFFFDTPDLKVSKSGVVVRARRVQGRGDDSTIKLRPIRPEELTPELRQTPGFKVEVDAMPGGKYVCSASMSAALGKDDVRPVAAKARPIRKLFSKAQRAFYDAHAPAGIALDDLSVLGPIFVLKTKFTPERFGRPMVAEFWLYPDGTAMLELSTKCLPAQTFQTAAEARASLLRHGVKTSGEQNTKTRKALDIYSARLLAEAAAAAEGRRGPRRRATAARKPAAASRALRSRARPAAPKPRAAAAEAAGPKTRGMTADRPARPARRALDDLSLPIDRADLDERLLGARRSATSRTGWRRSRPTRRCRPSRTASTRPTSTSGPRPSRTRRSTGRRLGATSRCRSRTEPPGCSCSPTAT